MKGTLPLRGLCTSANGGAVDDDIRIQPGWLKLRRSRLASWAIRGPAMALVQSYRVTLWSA